MGLPLPLPLHSILTVVMIAAANNCNQTLELIFQHKQIKERRSCGILGWKRNGKKRSLGKPRCRWNDNIKTDIHLIRWRRGPR